MIPLGGSVTSNPILDPSLVSSQPYPALLQHHQPTIGASTSGINDGMHHRGMSITMDDYRAMDDYHRNSQHVGMPVPRQNSLYSGPSNGMIPGGTITGGTMPDYGDPYAVPSPPNQSGLNGQPFGFGSPLPAAFFRNSPTNGSPGWPTLPPLSPAMYPPTMSASSTLRYPILRPLLPHLASIIPITLACDLLELYFANVNQTFMQPQSPYVLASVFRKRGFLRQDSPRPCSPALLASMLWVAAQTSKSAFLTSPPSARGKICQKLLELTVGLLKPLIHTPADASHFYGGNVGMADVALGGLGVARYGQTHEMEGGLPGSTGVLDDIATYMNLAIVVSASEYKGVSLRWWNAAWSLARELKLGRELPPNPSPTKVHGQEQETGMNGALGGSANSVTAEHSPGYVSEEEREERRRIWWLLYIVDRHLALCYNRPLFLLDVECEGLLHPDDEREWQAGEVYMPETHSESAYFRRRGPSVECTSHSIFGYFLPLMTMLGEIVDLNQVRNHPRPAMRYVSDDQVAEVTQQLQTYEQSLKDFRDRHTESSQFPEHGAEDATSPHSTHTTTSSNQRMSDTAWQTRIVFAYGTHILHTLHILLNGKWDPISLLDDNDRWISSPTFVSATSHAVSAAESIDEILDYDPDLSFMPFFFGIYLLQGSFLLLLIADKLQSHADPSVVKACESIVRAHEACVVTLNTQYQVSLPIFLSVNFTHSSERYLGLHK